MPLCYFCEVDKPQNEMASKDTCTNCLEMQALSNEVVDQHFHELLASPPTPPKASPYKEKLFFFAARTHKKEAGKIEMGAGNHTLHYIETHVEQNSSVNVMSGCRWVLPAQITLAGNNVLDRVLALGSVYGGCGDDHKIGIHRWQVFTDGGVVKGVEAQVYYVPTACLEDKMEMYSAVDLGLTSVPTG